MMSYDIERKGLMPTYFVDVLGQQLSSSGFEKIERSIDYTPVYERGNVRIYTSSSPTCEIHYSRRDKDPVSSKSTLGQILKDIQAENGAKRYCIPIAEKREGSKIGHYTLLVIDRDENGHYSATQYDSKTNRSPLAYIIRFLAAILFIPLNGSQKLENSLQATLGSDAKVSLERKYYHQQPSLFNNSCSIFTMRLLRDEDLLSAKEPMIPKSNHWLRASTSFLTAEDMHGYRNAIDKSLQSGNALDYTASTEFDDNVLQMDFLLPDDMDENQPDNDPSKKIKFN